MSHFPPAIPHGPLREVFTDVFFVTGNMHALIGGAPWQFSRNMTVVRDGDQLTLINAVRLDADGLAQLDHLGQVAHVVRTIPSPQIASAQVERQASVATVRAA